MGDIDSAIGALRKAEEYMTRGPWRYDVILDCVNDHADAAGIVAMRNAFSALLDVAEAARSVRMNWKLGTPEGLDALYAALDRLATATEGRSE